MDDIDKAQEQEQIATDDAIRQARRAAAEIPPGKAGECELCGEWSGRLVNGTCAHCRDKWRLQ